jgi:hypothetical protein
LVYVRKNYGSYLSPKIVDQEIKRRAERRDPALGAPPLFFFVEKLYNEILR